MTTHILGEGRVNWSRDERMGDRYGLLYLEGGEPGPEGVFDPHHTITPAPLKFGKLLGKVGKLRAVVLDTRKSCHIGDIFHGFAPQTPTKGEVIELGVGTLFTEWIPEVGGGIGVRPLESRDHFWMNPPHLYRCHEQTVRLEFVEGDTNMEPWVFPS